MGPGRGQPAGRRLLATCHPSATVAVCTGVPVAVWSHWAGGKAAPNHYHVLLMGFVLAGLAWLGAIIATGHPIWQEMRQFWRKRQAAS